MIVILGLNLISNLNIVCYYKHGVKPDFKINFYFYVKFISDPIKNLILSTHSNMSNLKFGPQFDFKPYLEPTAVFDFQHDFKYNLQH